MRYLHPVTPSPCHPRIFSTLSAMRLRVSLPMMGLCAWLLAGGGGLAAQPAAEDALEPATASAIYLMQRSVQVRRDGLHNRLLGSLRHLRDPLLEPLFAELARASHPALQIHGNLALAELSPARELDLRRLAEIDDPAVQAELVTAAMDADLLSHVEAAKLLAWPGLDMGVRLLAAARLMEAGELADEHHASLRKGLDAGRLARRGLAALLLHQLGDATGTAGLQAINDWQGDDRDAVRAMLLNTAMRHKFERSGDWAYAVASEPGVERRLGLLALQTAMRFGHPRAATHWQTQFQSTRDTAQRTRLALVALQMAPWLEAGVFETLREAEDELIQQMGDTGLAIAEGRPTVADAVLALIGRQHAVANGWALHYAATDARPADARRILLGLIDAYEDAPDEHRIRRLDEAVQATQTLYEQDPAAAAELLRPRLTDADRDALLVRGILLGLVRTQQGEPWRVIDPITDWPDADADRLALLLRARHDQPLTDRQMRELGVMVQGGGGLQDSLRIQAAWAWLKRKQQTHLALAAVLGDR